MYSDDVGILGVFDPVGLILLVALAKSTQTRTN